MIRRACLGTLLLIAVSAGCKGEPAKVEAAPPEVLVSTPVIRSVTDYEIFTGRTESAHRAELRSRVTGYLEKTSFKEGDLVKKDDLLFLIDPKPYQAELARAEASLAQAQAHARRLDGDFERAQGLYARNAIGREEYEKLRGDRDEAKAGVRVAEAVVKLAENSLKYTEIRAPFNGRISRRMFDPGNLIKADETILTTLVSEELIYAYFDVDERTFLRQLLRGGKVDSTLAERLPLQIGLADEDGFPHPGLLNFVENRLEAGTGSLWIRAEFIDPKLPLKPGMFIRVRFPLGAPYPATLIAEQALGTDQGQRFVYVVDGNGKIEYRPVKVGRLQDDGMRVILDGLKPSERIVVAGLQRARAGATVTPKPVEMPNGAGRANGRPAT